MMTEEVPVMQYLDSQTDGHGQLNTGKRYRIIKMSGYDTLSFTGYVTALGGTNNAVNVRIYEASGDLTAWHYLSTTFANNKVHVNSTATFYGMSIGLPAGASTNLTIAKTLQITNRASVYYIAEAFMNTGTADFTLNCVGTNFNPS